MSGVISRWLGAIDALPLIAERLLRVQIENRPAEAVIRLYDPRKLFYCDPPYIHTTRGDSKAYSNEMTDDEHSNLAELLTAVKAKVALSNYDCPLMDRLYPKKKWFKLVGSLKTIHSTKGKRSEVSDEYDPHEQTRPMKLLFLIAHSTMLRLFCRSELAHGLQDFRDS